MRLLGFQIIRVPTPSSQQEGLGLEGEEVLSPSGRAPSALLGLASACLTRRSFVEYLPSLGHYPASLHVLF